MFKHLISATLRQKKRYVNKKKDVYYFTTSIEDIRKIHAVELEMYDVIYRIILPES
jgi:hypothetical protein